MKIQLIAIFSLIAVATVNAQKDEPINFKKTLAVAREDLIGLGYSGGVVDIKKQPIASRDDAMEFLSRLNKKVDLGDFKPVIDNFVTNVKVNHPNEYTIIVFRHSLNLDKLHTGNIDNEARAKKDYADACARLKKVNSLLGLADSKFDLKDVGFKPAGAYDPNLLTAAQLAEMNDLSSFKENLLSEKKKLEDKMKESRELYKASIVEIVEEDKVENYILNKHDKDWDDYLLNKKDIILVFIGGIKDFAQANIVINNKPSYLQTNLNELYQVAQGTVLQKDARDEQACGITDKGLQSLPLTLVMLRNDKIKAPSEIGVSFKEKSDTVRFNIHERIKFSIKLGFSGAMLDRKNFSLNADDQLTITADSAKKQELKSNLMVVFEWIPWGRDIDRMEPVWAKNKQIDFFSMQRFGIIGGVKLSKDPLQTILAGVSYSLSKEASLNFGIGFYATPIDVKNLPVGKDAALDYLRQNAERELKPKLFIGKDSVESPAKSVPHD